MIKLNQIAGILAGFIALSLLLSLVGIISFNFSEILSYSLIVLGIYFVYSEAGGGNIILVFVGAVTFLAGTYFRVVDYFNLKTNAGLILPIILMFSGAGLFIVYLAANVKKIFLILSILLFAMGLTLMLAQSHFKIYSFLQSVLAVLNFLWPVIIIVVLIVLLVRNK
ncbi:MAG: hypothetical protein ACHQLA_01620 [Ignavibacteriales bacterium]